MGLNEEDIKKKIVVDTLCQAYSGYLYGSFLKKIIIDIKILVTHYNLSIWRLTSGMWCIRKVTNGEL